MAESWLKEQAQAQGWAKATRLEGRPTKQGLVAVAVDSAGRHGSMVEVNCETDFVARNKSFQAMVEGVAAACLKYIEGAPTSTISPFTKMHLDADQLKQLPSVGGSTLADEVALTINNIGENVVLRRAVGLKTKASESDGLFLTGYVHPTPSQTNSPVAIPLLGRYGSLVMLKGGADRQKEEIFGKQLCQHIVGMNPLKIGSEEDKPAKDPDDEKVLILQEYLLDPSTTVGPLLTSNSVSILDFVRYECGEETLQDTENIVAEAVN
ncbi:hypothetical protein J437_LFUL011887 [Ladona fulva]|uniref:Elongation factor Ts, mitochondrial n=1 Tax=Ladona fulva TaxID=123851 RepID=A0A8K0P3J0_LADFU|nr:hypothetical protein J437_LFUL011887 [Ladona fulva]